MIKLIKVAKLDHFGLTDGTKALLFKPPRHNLNPFHTSLNPFQPKKFHTFILRSHLFGFQCLYFAFLSYGVLSLAIIVTERCIVFHYSSGDVHLLFLPVFLTVGVRRPVTNDLSGLHFSIFL